MTEKGIEKRLGIAGREKGQYALAFGVVAVMLYAVGFPVFILFFFSVLAYFIWKAFSYESRTETRQIFEFYLTTNEIIRDDGRRWYGFELQEAIASGEAILKAMAAPPPLVRFGLGILCQKAGDHGSAVKHLEHVVSETAPDEMAVVFPTKELREYVRVLRKIERTPGEAPLTSSAVRSLERIRKNRGMQMLELSRSALSLISATPGQLPPESSSVVELPQLPETVTAAAYDLANINGSKKDVKDNSVPEHQDRQTISEVLHDIYDNNNVQG